MPAFQQPTAPTQAPAAPALPTPQAPATTQGPPTADQMRALRDQARKMAEQARAQGRAARDAAQAGKDAAQAAEDAAQAVQQNGPVIVIPSHRNGDFQWDPAQLRPMVENLASYFFVTVAVIAIGVPLVRALSRRLGPAPIAPPLPKAVSDQLQRIETAVESMAIEIERISESQRFLTKLQAGQPQPAALPPRSGS
jgi:hypothetical protein